MLRPHCRHSLLSFMLALLLISACDDPFEHAKCRGRITFSEQNSPDRAFSASVYGWACEQQADKVTQTKVTVRSLSDFSAFEDVFTSDGKYPVKTNWLSAREVLVEREAVPNHAVIAKLDSWHGVKISFKC